MKNQPKTFRRNKLKDLFFLLIFLIFVAGAYSLLEKNPLIGWVGLSFFGIGTLFFLIQLLTNVSYLKLTEEGFEERSLFQKKKYKWSDVKGFRQANFRGNESIFFDYNDKSKKKKDKNKLSKFLHRKQKSITSSYNIKTEELLSLMNKYKQKK